MKRNFAASLLALSMFFISLSGNFVIAQTVIGGSTPDPSAILDVQSTSKGVLMPRMTTTQRNSITAPATGLVIFNTTTGCLEINLGTFPSPNWTEIKCTVGLIVSLDADNSRLTGSVLMPNVAASTNSARVPYTGGNGKGHDGQTVSSTGVTGLTATLASGNFAVGADSLTYDISGTPTASGQAKFVLNIGSQEDTLKVSVGCGAYVAANTWKVFTCHNLGSANTGADPFTPSWEIIGNYWRWGTTTKAADGPSNATTPNDGSVSGWTSLPVGVDGDWADNSKGPNDPCPSGYKVPSITQWEGVYNTANNKISNVGSSWTDSPTNFSTGKMYGPNLFLPAAGRRPSTTGQLLFRGNFGGYWSSTVDGGNAKSFTLAQVSNGSSISINRALGYSVRCIAE